MKIKTFFLALAEATTKRIITVTLCLLASLGAAGIASAQDHAIRATVPFSFYFGDQFMPAGTYMITSNSTNPVGVVIRGDDNKTIAFRAAQLGHESRLDTMTFKKYGKQVFLHGINCASAGMRYSFPPARTEKQLGEKQSLALQAKVDSPKDVYVPLKQAE